MERNRSRLIMQRAMRPISEWSRRYLSLAERRAAKGLWAASTRLGRMAYRLDKAGMSLAVDVAPRGRGRGIRIGTNGGIKDVELLPEEACTPHLA